MPNPHLASFGGSAAGFDSVTDGVERVVVDFNRADYVTGFSIRWI